MATELAAITSHLTAHIASQQQINAELSQTIREQNAKLVRLEQVVADSDTQLNDLRQALVEQTRLSKELEEKVRLQAQDIRKQNGLDNDGRMTIECPPPDYGNVGNRRAELRQAPPPPQMSSSLSKFGHDYLNQLFLFITSICICCLYQMTIIVQENKFVSLFTDNLSLF